jgi:hypothetical protein
MNGTPNAPGRADNFDTAVYQGNRADYTITINNGGTPLNFADDVVIVTDNSATPRDGIDHLTHIERLQFADQRVELVPGLDAGPLGVPVITDATPVPGHSRRFRERRSAAHDL